MLAHHHPSSNILSSMTKHPLQTTSPILYAAHRTVQHPRLMFYQPAVSTIDLAEAIDLSLRSRCNNCFNIIGIAISIIFSVILAAMCVTCAIISLPLMMTSSIGFFAALLAEAIAAFTGVAAYAINQRLRTE